MPSGIGAIKVLISFIDKKESRQSFEDIPSEELVANIVESNHMQ